MAAQMDVPEMLFRIGERWDEGVDKSEGVVDFEDSNPD